MKIKFFTIMMSLVFMASAFSQSNLNDYKYVIVPKGYDFLKGNNQYRLNELTKFLFEKQGFLTLMEGENYPDELIKNRCLALKSDVTKDSGLFKTKLSVELKDCNDQAVYTTQVGESREKDFGKAYNEALRDAFKSFNGMNYHYVPKQINEVVETKEEHNNNVAVVQEIQQLKEEIKNLKQEKKTEVVEAVVPQMAEKMEAIVNVNPIEKGHVKKADVKVVSSDVLYAQPIENGFQLVDSSPKVVYKIKKTSLENVFLVEGFDGTLLNKKGQWILEYYENGSLKQKVLNIKF